MTKPKENSSFVNLKSKAISSSFYSFQQVADPGFVWNPNFTHMEENSVSLKTLPTDVQHYTTTAGVYLRTSVVNLVVLYILWPFVKQVLSWFIFY